MTAGAITSRPAEAPAPAIRAFPFSNDWARGCSVWLPIAKADREYVYQREWAKGVTHKASGMVRYGAGDLGAPGWAVAKDRRGVRALIMVLEHGWADMGEVAPADVLRIVRAGAPGLEGAWAGERCETDGAPIVRGVCSGCEAAALEDSRRAEAAEARAAAPADDPF